MPRETHIVNCPRLSLSISKVGTKKPTREEDPGVVDPGEVDTSRADIEADPLIEEADPTEDIQPHTLMSTSATMTMVGIPITIVMKITTVLSCAGKNTDTCMATPVTGTPSMTTRKVFATVEE